MGVDFLTCKYCGNTFADCGDYEYCECSRVWCSLECAEADGYKEATCKLGYDIYDNECEDSCYNCNNRIKESCNYCRNEDHDDETLLNYALELLGIDRVKLVDRYNKYTGKKKD